MTLITILFMCVWVHFSTKNAYLSQGFATNVAISEERESVDQREERDEGWYDIGGSEHYNRNDF